jgi:hypothetical protein
MKALVEKIAFKSSLVQRLFSSGTLRRAGVRPQPARSGRGVDSWLVFGLTRVSSPGLGRHK